MGEAVTAPDWDKANVDAAAEMAYWTASREELWDRYPGRYVAVYRGDLIADDTDLVRLLNKVRGMGVDPAETWTRFIRSGERRYTYP